MTQEITKSHNSHAIFLDRFNGVKNAEISKKYNIPLNTVNDSFAVNGKWYTDYRRFEGELNQKVIQEAKSELIKSVMKASNTLSGLLNSKNENVALKASLEILDRVTGKEPSQDKPEMDIFKQIMESILKKVDETEDEKIIGINES